MHKEPRPFSDARGFFVVTLILARSDFMAADRRVTDEGEVSSMVKVAKNRHLAAAASGNASCTLAVKRAVQRGAQSPESLVELVDADSYALVLTAQGVIQRIQDGQLWPCSAGLQAIGSGADLALGYLHDRGELDQPLIRRAFRFVASRRSDCGGGVDFRTFDR